MTGWKEIATTTPLDEVKKIFKRAGAELVEREDYVRDSDHISFSIYATSRNTIIRMGGYDHKAFSDIMDIMEVFRSVKPEKMIVFDGNDTSDTGEWWLYEMYNEELRERTHKVMSQGLAGWNSHVAIVIDEVHDMDILRVNPESTEYTVFFEDEEEMKKGFEELKVMEAI